MKWLKTRGFTDKLYLINLIFTWLCTIACFVVTVLGQKLSIMDYSIIVYGLPCIWAELSIHTGFIIWKAKTENINKYGNKENITM